MSASLGVVSLPGGVMELPSWVGQAFALALTLSYWHQFGLAFLLGSFAVATWSDVKHLSAQREFLEIWVAFLAGVLGFDVYEATAHAAVPWQVPAIKWGMIALFSLLSFERLPLPYRLFRLAPADVAALAAAASLLTPLLIVLFYLGAKLLSNLIGPWLRRGKYYPFMPVVSLATVGILALALFWQATHGSRPVIVP
jgi:hypothetical protein